MHPAQAAQGLEVHRGIAHGQVAALDQWITQLPGQVQVLEIALVEAPRGQQHHQRRVLGTGRQPRQGLLQGTEKTSQVLHLQVAVQLGQGSRDDGAVLQRETCARRRLGTVGSDPPATVRGAGKVHRIDMQIGPFRWSDTLAGPEKIVMAIDQFGRQQAFTDQLLRPVDIGQHRIEQSCALFNTRRQLLPFGGGQQVRQQVQLPRPVGTLGVGIDIVGDAVLA
ncbi:hypothetical protein D3C76_786320 [compost metagenome]